MCTLRHVLLPSSFVVVWGGGVNRMLWWFVTLVTNWFWREISRRKSYWFLSDVRSSEIFLHLSVFIASQPQPQTKNHFRRRSTLPTLLTLSSVPRPNYTFYPQPPSTDAPNHDHEKHGSYSFRPYSGTTCITSCREITRIEPPKFRTSHSIQKHFHQVVRSLVRPL